VRESDFQRTEAQGEVKPPAEPATSPTVVIEAKPVPRVRRDAPPSVDPLDFLEIKHRHKTHLILLCSSLLIVGFSVVCCFLLAFRTTISEGFLKWMFAALVAPVWGIVKALNGFVLRKSEEKRKNQTQR
jgi:hypothetical protein